MQKIKQIVVFLTLLLLMSCKQNIINYTPNEDMFKAYTYISIERLKNHFSKKFDYFEIKYPHIEKIYNNHNLEEIYKDLNLSFKKNKLPSQNGFEIIIDNQSFMIETSPNLSYQLKINYSDIESEYKVLPQYNFQDIHQISLLILQYDQWIEVENYTIENNELIWNGHHLITLNSFESDSVEVPLHILVNKEKEMNTEFNLNLQEFPIGYAIESGYYANKRLVDAFVEMANDMKNEGLNALVTSAYRSVESQSNLYKNYIQENGLEKASRFVAKPKYSEHHTALAIDLVTPGASMFNFKETEEYQWILKNAHKYGFIIRYPENKEHITGYMPEAWHLRYLGNQLAHEVVESKLTFDEFYYNNIRR